MWIRKTVDVAECDKSSARTKLHIYLWPALRAHLAWGTTKEQADRRRTRGVWLDQGRGLAGRAGSSGLSCNAAGVWGSKSGREPATRMASLVPVLVKYHTPGHSNELLDPPDKASLLPPVCWGEGGRERRGVR